MDRRCDFQSGKPWLDLQFHDGGEKVKRPDELAKEMKEPRDKIDRQVFDQVHGSLVGMALGDALGAHVEFRPHEYLTAHPVKDLEGGGTWGLVKGQFTDDTSMALCLANSLIARGGFVPYDQLVRYKWWHKHGYMSSTGDCFDIGAATSQSVREFERKQKTFAKDHDLPLDCIDYLSNDELLKKFNVYCSSDGVAGNGALMRLAPVPLFFYRSPADAVEYAGISGKITHGDVKAYDACRYYGALIVAALWGVPKDQLLHENFYNRFYEWFREKPLDPDIQEIANGSFKKDGYAAGIRGKGYIVRALEAALWAFWSDDDSFTTGALKAVNLGDDTDTTAAIYGQLAGAYYGFNQLPEEWKEQVYAKEYIAGLSKWIIYEGHRWQREHRNIDWKSVGIPPISNSPVRQRRKTVHELPTHSSFNQSDQQRDEQVNDSSDEPAIDDSKIQHKSTKKSMPVDHSQLETIDESKSPSSQSHSNKKGTRKHDFDRPPQTTAPAKERPRRKSHMADTQSHKPRTDV